MNRSPEYLNRSGRLTDHLTLQMSSVALVHPKETLTVPVLQAMNKCTLFQQNAALLLNFIDMVIVVQNKRVTMKA
jgi:hypothetical protein